MGKTMLLATVVSSKDAKEGVNFLPLTVDYREKFAADGRYPGGFSREARPSDQEILVMRLVDRVYDHYSLLITMLKRNDDSIDVLR